MEARLSARGLRILSYVVISFFGALGLFFFLFSVDKTAVVTMLSSIMLLAALYFMWTQDETDAASLLIFFFGTTACFSFFSDVLQGDLAKLVSIAVFAALSLILTNYLLNTVKPGSTMDKYLYKISLAIVYTEIFWVLSFLNASPISKGAITAIIFFNLQFYVKDLLDQKLQLGKSIFLLSVSLILLAVVIYRI